MRKIWLTIILVAFAAIAALPCAGFARNRMYHPTLGQFLQRDPVGTPLESPATLARNVSDPRFTQRDPTAQDGDGMNLYLYVGGNPLRYVDPMGTWKIDVDSGCDCPCPPGKPQSGNDVKSKDIRAVAEAACDQIRTARQEWQTKIVAPIANGMYPGLAQDNVRLAQRIMDTLKKMEDRCNSGLNIECETGGGTKGLCQQHYVRERKHRRSVRPSPIREREDRCLQVQPTSRRKSFYT